MQETDRLIMLSYRLGWSILNYIIYEFQVISTSNDPPYLEYLVAYIILKVNRNSEI